jgi:hexokinase
MAVHLPVSHIGLGKFGARPQTWIQGAKHVIVNTEVSMFGKDILPTTRWDMALNAAHAQRDFQPLELMVGGRYLGEIARLAILEAVESARLFGGEVPEGLEAPYSLPTEILSQMQA